MSNLVLIRSLHIHPLEFTNERVHEEYKKGWLCELCDDIIRNPLTKSYHCETCLFDICEKCYRYIFPRKPKSDVHKHEMNLEQRNEEWECDICDQSYYMRRSWYCNLCNFDVCYYCYWE